MTPADELVTLRLRIRHLEANLRVSSHQEGIQRRRAERAEGECRDLRRANLSAEVYLAELLVLLASLDVAFKEATPSRSDDFNEAAEIVRTVTALLFDAALRPPQPPTTADP